MAGVDPDLTKILKMMLAFEPDKRASLEEILALPYFDNIREPLIEQAASR